MHGLLKKSIIQYLKSTKELLRHILYYCLYDKESVEVLSLFESQTMTKYHHVSVALRYIYIENYFKNNKKGMETYVKAHRNYYRYINRDYDEEKDIQSFNLLIESFKSNGYDPSSEIYVDNSGNIFNGAHRLALCLYFGIDKVTIRRVNRIVHLFTVDECFKAFSLRGLNKQCEDTYQRMKYNSSRGKKDVSKNNF